MITNNFNWCLNIEQIQSGVKKIIDNSMSTINYIIDNNSPKNTLIEQLNEDISDISTMMSVINISIVTNPQIKTQCIDLLNKLHIHIDKFYENKKLYNYILKFKSSNDNFINKLLLKFENNGIKLNSVDYDLFKKIKLEITVTEQQLQKIKSINDTIQLDPNYIKNIPKTLINSDNKIELNKYSYNILMKYIHDQELRKSIEIAYSHKYNKSIDTVSKLILLKNKMAKLLGFENWADYKLSQNMIKNTTNILNFLHDFQSIIDHRYSSEYTQISRYIDKIYSSDTQYCLNKIKLQYGINEINICDYFPTQTTFIKILNLFEKIFNIKFEKVINKKLWSKYTQQYNIYYDNKKISSVFIDLFNTNMSKHNINYYNIQPRSKKGMNYWAIIGNFNNLLYFNDVINIVHKITYGLSVSFADTCNQTQILNIFSSEYDYIRIPAQVIELYFWEPDSIKYLSNHCKTKEKLSDRLIEQMINIKNLDIGIHFKKHIVLSLFDNNMYSNEQLYKYMDNYYQKGEWNGISYIIKDLYKKTFDKVMVFDDTQKILLDDNYCFPTDWIDSDSLHYELIWSRIMATDIYATLRHFNIDIYESVGKLMIEKLFKYGCTKPAYDMISDYIKTKPSTNGFIKMYKLDVDTLFSYQMSTTQINNNMKEPNDNTYYTQPENPMSIGLKAQINNKNKIQYNPTESIFDVADSIELSDNNESQINGYSEISIDKIN